MQSYFVPYSLCAIAFVSSFPFLSFFFFVLFWLVVVVIVVVVCFFFPVLIVFSQSLTGTL